MSGKIQFGYLAAALGVLAVILIFLLAVRPPNTIRGAVVTSDANPTRELPIADVEVTILGDPSARSVRSDNAGFFAIPIPWHLQREPRITLEFRHPDYRPQDLPDVSTQRLCIARLVPSDRATPPFLAAEITIADVVVKYSISTTTTVNVGSAVKTFQVVNTGNVPCKGLRRCSPDGKWQAAEGSAVMDAGPGNEFHNARASCIAGPCPFTKIEGEGVNLSQDSRKLSVSALNWSDTATFLLEAEVYKPMVSDALRRSYPVILDRALTFTLPAEAEGVSIEAKVDGTMIVFPLGPSLLLSWADCQLLVNKDKTRVYRCELKPRYRFSAPSVNAGAAN